MFDPKFMIEITEGVIAPSDLVALDKLFDAASKHPGPIVFHFHGGLVSREAAINAALKDSPFYRQAGAFPIYPIWKTGPAEVLPKVLSEVAKETLFKLLLDRVLGLAHAHVKNVIGARGGSVERTLGKVDEIQLERSVLGLTGDFAPDFIDPSDFDQLRGKSELEIRPMEERSMERLIEEDTELLAEIDAILNGANMEVDDNTRSASVLSVKSPPKESHADREFLQDFKEDANERGFGLKAALSVVEIVSKFISRFISGKDHGVHATVVEEILRKVYGSFVGSIGWTVMKDYTEKAAAPGGASVELLKRIESKLGGKRVMLVGHSAGAIFVSNFFKAASKNGYEHTFEVVFLAPAVRCKTFKEGILDHGHLLSKDKDGNTCFRCFTMSDTTETQDILVRNIPHLGDLNWLYPRSLLYLISGILEGNEVDADVLGLDRFHSPAVWNADQNEIKDCRVFLKRPGHCCYAITPPEADHREATNSTMHGGFGSFLPKDNEPTNLTMVSVTNILKVGWER